MLTSASAATTTPVSATTLRELEVGRFDVFAVVSERFWRDRRTLVRDFFAHLKPLNSSGLLVTPTERVCSGVRADIELHHVACAVAQHYRHDGALSKERWRIMLHFLRRTQPGVSTDLPTAFVVFSFVPALFGPTYLPAFAALRLARA